MAMFYWNIFWYDHITPKTRLKGDDPISRRCDLLRYINECAKFYELLIIRNIMAHWDRVIRHWTLTVATHGRIGKFGEEVPLWTIKWKIWFNHFSDALIEKPIYHYLFTKIAERVEPEYRARVDPPDELDLRYKIVGIYFFWARKTEAKIKFRRDLFSRTGRWMNFEGINFCRGLFTLILKIKNNRWEWADGKRKKMVSENLSAQRIPE